MKPNTSRLRSLAKALTWRVIAMAVTAGVVVAAGGTPELAAGVASADTLLKIGLYYLHERLWCRRHLRADLAPPDHVTAVASEGACEGVP